MPLYRGTGGAVFDIASPDPAQLASGALVPVEEPAPQPEPPAAPAPRKRAPARKSPAK